MTKLPQFFRFLFNQRAVKPSLITLFFVVACVPAFAQTVNTVSTGVYYGDDVESQEYIPGNTTANFYCNWATTDLLSSDNYNKSFIDHPSPASNATGNDPWVSSALIEYDQPYAKPTNTAIGDYPNHCLALCTQVACSNLPVGQSTYSIAFPLQRVTFDIFKYYNGKNPKNPDELPAIRSIDIYPVRDTTQPTSYTCGSYHCDNAGRDKTGGDDTKVAECLGAHWICNGTIAYTGSNADQASLCWSTRKTSAVCEGKQSSAVDNRGTTKTRETEDGLCYYYFDGGDNISSANPFMGCHPGAGHSDCLVFDYNGKETLDTLAFCTGWDASYEIAGEFGKTNGDFGFRSTVSTDVPSDGVIADRIEISEMGVYPGNHGATQIPIQIDVTNVHTVRSTPSLVGTITPVSAQPYTFQYRLSKDADVRIAIFDASTEDDDAYATDNTTSFASSAADATDKIVRTLVDWQPRTGEGMKGTDKDSQISDFDSWDGRDDNGMLLPAGNYIASIQAKSQDEWPGVDFSRAVTRQVSLDPLKLTDVQVTGLNKKSTAYATISYVSTESATVYWEVYTPGTVFTDATSSSKENILTNSSTPTGTGPGYRTDTGDLVFRSAEQKTGRMVYTDRWDGTCQPRKSDGSLDTSGVCTRTYAVGEMMSNGQKATSANRTETFAYGAPMPDGNYVYVLWAEIPYNGCYHNAAATKSGDYYGAPGFEPGDSCTQSLDNNNKYFTGVKTLKYTVGTLELERGLVGISMQPASYSTLGSTPTAYGLDPFVFKYALDREAQVIATVENTAGLVVKHLTLEGGEPGVAQQLNTLTWDGRDDQGRMVYPGTYMFRVRAMDAMFPAQSNEAITVFPVDMYRVVDVSTTDVYGDSNAKATISYHLSKPMNVQINIYNKDVVLPNYNGRTGDYDEYPVVGTYTAQQTGVTSLTSSFSLTPVGGITATSPALDAHDVVVTYQASGSYIYRNTWSVAEEWDLDKTKYRGDDDKEYATGTYTVYLKQEKLNITQDTAVGVWPPRVCNRDDDDVFTSATGPVSPAKVNENKAACIYVNDSTFTNYPKDYYEASSGVLDVRLQPIHTFDRTDLSYGDDTINMEEWDALYFYNPTPNAARHTAAEITKCTGATEKSNCPYEMIPDGQYPFYLSARSNDVFNRYYYDSAKDGSSFVTGTPVPSDVPENVKQEDFLYASEKVLGKVNVTRGPVYFLEDSVQVYPNAPQLFNASSTTLTFIPPYEINFAISRAATVEAAIVALEPNMCSPVTDQVHSSKVNVFETRNNVAGEICKFLSTMTIVNTGTFDANVIRKLYWDGTDHNGNYVKPGMYEVRLTARNYPDAGLYQPTVKSITISADLLKVFDLLEADNYSIAVRGTDMKIGYQISVPMKVAIQIFKPGTTIYDYSKGTLRNPTTGKEVQDINEVLVRSIVGIRPGTTLIEEVWDGLDYAQQEVPDGVYPFRFVTSLDSPRIDSVTGEILVSDAEKASGINAIDFVADTYEYQNLHKATIAIGDGRFVCSDWQKTVLFYPNPLRNGKQGTLEITKMPVPGTVSIKYFNLAGDMVRNADYTCIDANNYQTTMGENLYFQPDNNVSETRVPLDANGDLAIDNVRNAALRCKWDANNQHGKKVARGVYFGLVDFKAFNGREHCQKVVKILIP